MPDSRTLLHLLADGCFHSGEDLAAALGVSRAAVWKGVRRLGEEVALPVNAVRGRGYRLEAPLELLERERVLALVGAQTRARLAELDLRLSVDSTNACLMQGAQDGLRSGTVCVAEHQRAGRGRRGRSWRSPFGGNLYLSLLWRFGARAAGLSGLSLATGVAVLRTLRAHGAAGVGLKWPNDILWDGRKLGGVLLELSGEAAGPAAVVIGVGINVRMAAGAVQIDQPWVDLDSVLGTRTERNALLARLLDELFGAVAEFEVYGLEPFLAEWRSADLLAGREVAIHLPDRSETGRALGVDAQGALLVESGGTRRSFTAGEVSVRRV